MTHALVLRTAGTNCDEETMHALKISGASADLKHVQEIYREPELLHRYAIMVVPGGFSYGDDIAAGKILANELQYKLGAALRQFVANRRLLIGVCNGFQVLVKAKILPAVSDLSAGQDATLTLNSSGRFQCHWTTIKCEKSKAAWLNNLPKTFELPIAHGEGRFVAKDKDTLAALEKNGQVVFRYHASNPNGSNHDIAGICNPAGNVLGLMPHPERFITKYQHPLWTQGKIADPTPGFKFWQAAVDYAKGIK